MCSRVATTIDQFSLEKDAKKELFFGLCLNAVGVSAVCPKQNGINFALSHKRQVGLNHLDSASIYPAELLIYCHQVE